MPAGQATQHLINQAGGEQLTDPAQPRVGFACKWEQIPQRN